MARIAALRAENVALRAEQAKLATRGHPQSGGEVLRREDMRAHPGELINRFQFVEDREGARGTKRLCVAR